MQRLLSRPPPVGVCAAYTFGLLLIRATPGTAIEAISVVFHVKHVLGSVGWGTFCSVRRVSRETRLLDRQGRPQIGHRRRLRYWYLDVKPGEGPCRVAGPHIMQEHPLEFPSETFGRDDCRKIHFSAYEATPVGHSPSGRLHGTQHGAHTSVGWADMSPTS